MKSLVYIALGWLAPIVVFLVATPLLVDALGFVGYGVFALASTLVAAGATIDLGLGALMVRELARSRLDPAGFHRQAAGLNSIFAGLGLVAALLVWAAGGVIARWLTWDQALLGQGAAAVRWAGLWLGLAFVNAGLASCLRAVERFGLLTLLTSGALVATWSVAVVGARAGLHAADVIALAAGVAAVQVLCGSAAQARVFGRWPRLGRLPRFEAGAARFAGSAFLGQATTLATYNADKAVVSGVLGAAPAGMYVAAANIANKPLSFVATLAAILFPRVAALEGQGRAFVSARIYLAASRMLAAVSTLFVVVGLVLAGDFVRLWLGASVPADVATAFRVLLLAYWATTLSVAPSNALAGQGNMHRGAAFALAGGVITLGLCVLLVPRFGIVGAAAAGLAGMTQAVVFELWAHHEAQARVALHRFRLRRTVTALAVCGGLAATVAAFATRLLPSGWVMLVIAATAGSVVFVVSWFGLRLALREERVLLARLLRWIGARKR